MYVCRIDSIGNHYISIGNTKVGTIVTIDEHLTQTIKHLSAAIIGLQHKTDRYDSNTSNWDYSVMLNLILDRIKQLREEIRRYHRQ